MESLIDLLDRRGRFEQFGDRVAGALARRISADGNLGELVARFGRERHGFQQIKSLIVHGYFTCELVQRDLLKVHWAMSSTQTYSMRLSSAPEYPAAGRRRSYASEACARWFSRLAVRSPTAEFQEHVQPYEMPYRGIGDRRRANTDEPVQSQSTGYDELSRKFFVNDRENPYTHPDDAPFTWIRGRQVGGRSITWARQVYRWSDLDFEANLRDGHGNDWPIRYAQLAPWYSHVERFIGVSGAAEGLAHLARQRVSAADGVGGNRIRCTQQFATRLWWTAVVDHRPHRCHHPES